MADALPEHDHDPAQLRGGKAADDGQLFVQIHALIVGAHVRGELGVQAVDLVLGVGDCLLIDLLGAVQRDHSAAGLQSIFDLILGLQMVPVSAVALPVPLLEHVEGRGGDHVREGPVGQVQFPDGLLRQDRVDVVVADGPDMAGAGEAQPVAKAHGEPVPLVAPGLGIGEELHQRPGVLIGQGAELQALFLGAGEGLRLLSRHRQKLFKVPADQGGHGAVVFVHGMLVHKEVGVAEQRTECIHSHHRFSFLLDLQSIL